MMIKADVRINVTDRVDNGERLEMAATVVAAVRMQRCVTRSILATWAEGVARTVRTPS